MRLEIDERVRVPQGDAKVIPYIFEEQDSGEPLEISTFDVSWEIQDTRTREKVLSLEDDGVNVIFTDDSEGLVQIKLDTDATSGLRSTDYREVVQVVGEAGDRTTWVGDSTFVLTENGG